MSRLHEALRRAEQEKPGDRGSPVADVPLPDGPANAGVDRMSTATECRPPEPQLSEQLPIDDLAVRCVRAEWRPDAALLTFRPGQERIGEEQFRSLRSRLYQARQRQPLQKLLVSSAAAAEGKTFVCGNLAQVIVRQRDRRVLLIDADLRAPRMHKLLGAPASPGLTDYLCGNAQECAIVQRGAIEGLFFIPAGTLVPNPAELLGNGRFQALLTRLSGAFEWVIIDSPPAVPVSDASVLAEWADGVLLVVKAAQTPLALVQKAKEELQHRPLLGVVLNRVDPHSGYASYYAKYEGRGERPLGGS
jgi:protein-tyrosine kinase